MINDSFGHLGHQMIGILINRKTELEHDFVITSWVLSVKPEIRVGVNVWNNGDQKDYVVCQEAVILLNTW